MSAEGSFFKCSFGKPEEQAEGVPIACNGVRACLPLVAETVGEECLQQRGEIVFGFHHSFPPFSSRRSVASRKSSGTAVIYQ